jgi:hypothetical protein
MWLHDETMNLLGAIRCTLKSRRFWKWQLAGAIIYAIPAAVRYATGIMALPILNWPGFWIGMLIPGNLLEKILVNAFFPGGAGGVAGEVFASNYQGKAVSGKAKYLARLGGALGETAAWSAFQFFGYYLLISGPAGSDNLFESVFVFPINFVLAALSIFTPDVVELASKGFSGFERKMNCKKLGFPTFLFDF